MARISRVVVWCDSPTTVRKTFELFSGGLGFKALTSPGAGQVKRRLLPGSTSVSQDAFSASVSDGRMDVDFAAFPWVTSARSLFKRPSATQLMTVCLEGGEKVDGGIYSTESIGANSSTGSAYQRAAFMQPLAWLDQPNIHPIIMGEERIDQDRAPEKDYSGTLTEASHVKEVVIGEADERLFASADLFRKLAPHRFLPGLVSFGSDPGQSYETLVPVVRVRSANTSALVLKVGVPLADACAALDEFVRGNLELDSADVNASLNEFTTSNSASSRSDAGFAEVNASFLKGLSVRLCESEQFQSQYVEPEQSSRSKMDYSVEFGRQDMGTMSCTSVSGMEIKEGIFRAHRHLLHKLGRTSRPLPEIVLNTSKR